MSRSQRKIPVVGTPKRWKWFPRKPRYDWLRNRFRSRYYVAADELANWDCDLWKRHFDAPPQRCHGPDVFWSRRMTVADARTYTWGVVLSRPRYLRVPKARRRRWLRDVLLHEYLHVAGYGHDARFRAYAKQLGTW